MKELLRPKLPFPADEEKRKEILAKTRHSLAKQLLFLRKNRDKFVQGNLPALKAAERQGRITFATAIFAIPLTAAVGAVGGVAFGSALSVLISALNRDFSDIGERARQGAILFGSGIGSMGGLGGVGMGSSVYYVGLVKHWPKIRLVRAAAKSLHLKKGSMPLSEAKLRENEKSVSDTEAFLGEQLVALGSTEPITQHGKATEIVEKYLKTKFGAVYPHETSAEKYTPGYVAHLPLIRSEGNYSVVKHTLRLLDPTIYDPFYLPEEIEVELMQLGVSAKVRKSLTKKEPRIHSQKFAEFIIEHKTLET